jgi:hypothetical protein
MLVLVAEFADSLWPILLLLGLEQARIAFGITRGAPLDFATYPRSQSLGQPPSPACPGFFFGWNFVGYCAGRSIPM